MELENIYEGTTMVCIKPTRVYIKRDRIGDLSSSEKKNLEGEVSWKGQYYVIQKGDLVEFERSNGWDKSYFSLESGVEFVEGCGNPLRFFKKENFKIKKLVGNSYDENYLEFVKINPKFKQY